MNEPVSSYRGDDAYAFISYAHEDRDLVQAELSWLNGQGINTWFDEGIHPGSDWSDELAKAIAGSQCFVFFVTPRSVLSRTCLDELAYAQNQNSPVVAIHLEPTELSGGLASVSYTHLRAHET